ncbi:hypothetical protein PROFUN_11130 [Planoprotostelium fungivorum]|uniref:Translin n=1 Tax=Planoprotostelium fungivorum TaxID=1890364 RepID=A0A2P6NAS6_9EUKA|nr:hypothetical protein PROFUN_11130 [Planoprotostelium fungivorum]
MEEAFSKCNEIMEAESKVREDMKPLIKEIERISRSMSATMQQIHGKISQIEEICDKALSQVPELQTNFVQLSNSIPKGMQYKYQMSWKHSLGQVVFVFVLSEWLKNNHLVKLETITERVLGAARDNGLSIELEDYLFGICSVPNELSRLCVNSVTASNYTLPLRISQFVGEIYAGFRLLNLKNDGLRKKYDGIKYDMKKIEEVVYDISIRKLIPVPQQ